MGGGEFRRAPITRPAGNDFKASFAGVRQVPEFDYLLGIVPHLVQIRVAMHPPVEGDYRRIVGPDVMTVRPADKRGHWVLRFRVPFVSLLAQYRRLTIRYERRDDR